MRRRVFWIALPIALVAALWLGPGLSSEDEARTTSPTQPPTEVDVIELDALAFDALELEVLESDAVEADALDSTPIHVIAPAGAAPTLECETTPDPGPDGDL